MVSTSSYKKVFIKLVENTFVVSEISFSSLYFVFKKFEIGSIDENEAIKQIAAKVRSTKLPKSRKILPRQVR